MRERDIRWYEVVDLASGETIYITCASSPKRAAETAAEGYSADSEPPRFRVDGVVYECVPTVTWRANKKEVRDA